MCACTCLLRGDQAVLGRAQDAADEAELIHGELGRLGDLLLLQKAADGESAAVAARPVRGRTQCERRKTENRAQRGDFSK